MPSATDRLSQLLLKNEVINEKQLALALERQKESGSSLGKVLLEMGVVKENQLAEVIARELGLGYVDLLEYKINIQATTSIEESTAQRYTCIPIDFEDGKLVVAMADPTNIYALDDIRLSTGYEVKPVVSAREDILSATQRYYHLDTDVVEEALEGQGVGGERGDLRRGGRHAPRAFHHHHDQRRLSTGGPATSTSTRGRTKCSSGTASTACCQEIKRAAQEHPPGHRLAHQDHLRPQHRGEARAPGRPLRHGLGRQVHRLPRRHPPHRLRGEGGHAYPGQIEYPAQAGGPGVPPRVAGKIPRGFHAAPRRPAGDGADR